MDGDLDFCVDALERVSRTFSRPIALLPEGDLRVAVITSYLLCRIADTVEDHPALGRDERLALFSALTDVLDDRGSPDRFVALLASVDEESDDLAVSRSLPRVVRVFGALPSSTRAAVVPWITEMIRGMAIYACRPRGEDGMVALDTIADLERYCWFVAGTVGRMLTDLFIGHIGGALDDERRVILRTHAEDFALGLQLTNVLKDVSDDRARHVSFVPRLACAAEGLSLATLADPAHRAGAHRVLAPIFARAERALDAAFDYALAVPRAERGIRLFCLLPVAMAIRTLALAKGNDDVFEPGRKVKIGRAEVAAIISDVSEIAGDDDALFATFTRLRAGTDQGSVSTM